VSAGDDPPYDHLIPAADTLIEPMSEEELADQRASLGSRVRAAHGRFWVELQRGFYEPVHQLARLGPEEARRPGVCWGYRCALDDEGAGLADGSVPVHVLSGLSDFGWHRLPNDSRRYLRKFPRLGISLVRVTDAALLEEQGYRVMLDWRKRVGVTDAPPGREEYLRQMRIRVSGPGWMTLAGLDRDRVLGYMSVWLVGATAYLQDSKVATDALPSRLGTALDHEALLALKRTGVATEVCAGLHTPELPQLTEYKVRHGFDVVHLPAVARMPRPIASLLRRFRPGVFYRLTGRGGDMQAA
jgi:hypothetical protein